LSNFIPQITDIGTTKIYGVVHFVGSLATQYNDCKKEIVANICIFF